MKKFIFILLFVVLGFTAKSKIMQLSLVADITITTSCGSIHEISNKKFKTGKDVTDYALKLDKLDCGEGKLDSEDGKALLD